MVKKLLAISVILFSFLVFSSFTYAVTLQNSSFESWTGNSPDGWTVNKNYVGTAPGTYNVEMSTEVPYSGKNAHIFVDTNPNAGTFDVTASIYQQLTGTNINERYSFSFKKSHGWGAAPGIGVEPGAYSDMSAGIDPYGGNNPFSANIIWGPNVTGDIMQVPADYSTLSVEATAQHSEITVFIRNRFYAETSWVFLPPHGSDQVLGRVTSNAYIDVAEISVIPEPHSFLLLGCGLFIVSCICVGVKGVAGIR